MIYLLSLQKGLRISIFLLLMLVSATAKNQKMNVLLIICDDLNDYIEGFGGHPQAQTPNIKRLMESGISFLDAHCNNHTKGALPGVQEGIIQSVSSCICVSQRLSCVDGIGSRRPCRGFPSSPMSVREEHSPVFTQRDSLSL